jgi:hypothetical protein
LAHFAYRGDFYPERTSGSGAGAVTDSSRLDGSEGKWMTSMSAADWDSRYSGSDLIWGSEPNLWVEQETAGLPPGRALDLACGEGRNSIWLAGRGWQVINEADNAPMRAPLFDAETVTQPATAETAA